VDARAVLGLDAFDSVGMESVVWEFPDVSKEWNQGNKRGDDPSDWVAQDRADEGDEAGSAIDGSTIDKERDERANQDTGDEFAESRHKRPEWFL